jgi:hypothetical protein
VFFTDLGEDGQFTVRPFPFCHATVVCLLLRRPVIITSAAVDLSAVLRYTEIADRYIDIRAKCVFFNIGNGK